jgi:hypothetical protein
MGVDGAILLICGVMSVFLVLISVTLEKILKVLQEMKRDSETAKAEASKRGR